MKVIALSRNFGHQAAISAGLEHARGDVVVMIDADLQDPPELIPRDARRVAQRRRRRLRRALLARGRDALQARHGALVLQASSPSSPGSSSTEDSGDFRLMDRRAARRAAGDARAQPLPARDDRVGGLHADRGGLRARRARRGGRRSSRRGKMLRFAFDAITSFSHAPLQAATLLGFVFSFLAFLGDPAHDRGALRGHLLARRADDDRDRAAARRHPAHHGGDHRRVRGPDLRRGQAPAAVRGARARQRGRPGEDRRPRRRRVRAWSPRTGSGARGTTVDVYERWPGLGGQAATFDLGDGTRLERYYHHLFTSDRHIAALYDELGMPDAIEWHESSVAFFARGALHPFVTPLDLLRFSPLPPLARVRLGVAVLGIQKLGGRSGALRGRHGAGVDRALDGPRGVARGLGAAAARQVRRPRRRHRDGLAVEQAAGCGAPCRARTSARSGSATRAGRGSRCSPRCRPRSRPRAGAC